MRKKFLFIILLLIIIPLLYYSGGHKYIDNHLSNYVTEQLDKMIINKYNTSVSKDADPENLDKLNKISNLVKDNEIKSTIQETISSIKGQVKLQHELLRSSDELYKSTKYTKMNIEDVDRNIQRAYEVNNPEIRQKILKLNQEIKDRTSTVERAEASMSTLNEDPSLANYYIAQSYVDAVKYEDVKLVMQSDLNKNYKTIMDEVEANTARSEKEVTEEIEKIVNHKFTFEQSSSKYQQLSPTVYYVYTQFPEADYILAVSSKHIELYSDYELKEQGIVVSKTAGIPFPSLDKLKENSEDNILKISNLLITSSPDSQTANLIIDPNFYEKLLSLVDKEVAIIEIR